MAESFAERRRRELGLDGSQALVQPQTTNEPSFAERRRMELGLVPDTRPVEKPKSFQEKLGVEPPPMSLRYSPVVQGATQMQRRSMEQELSDQAQLDQQARNNAALVEANPTAYEPPAPDPPRPGRDIPVLGDVLQGLDWVGEKVEPVASVARSLYTPGAGIANIGGAYNAIGSLIGKVSPKLGSTLGGRVAQEAIKEAVVGTPVAAGQALTHQTTDLGEVAKQGLVGGALGAVTGGAGPLVAAGAKKVVNSAIERYLGPVIQNVAERGKTPAEEAFDAATKAGKIPNKLTPVGNEAQLDKVMTQIKPVVDQRLAVPYENPNELAKYVQNGLRNQGAELSLKEIGKVPYDGLVEMAEEIKRGANVYDEAVKAAKDAGYDLPALLEGKTPSLRDRVTKDASARAAGVYPESLPKVIEPLTNAIEEAPTKSSLFERLFGEQRVGFTPFGSNKSNRMVTTEQQIVSNPLKNNVSGLVERTKQAARGSYQNTVDYLSPLKTISPQTYETAMDASRANNISNTIIRDKFVDLEGNVIGSSLDDIMRQTRGLGKKVDDYLVLRHAITRMERGERVYNEALQMTPDKARAAVQKLESQYPELKKVGAEWDAYNTNLLDSGVREGLISQASRDAMRRDNPNYASMRRQFTLGEKMAQPKWSGGSAFSGQSAPIKEVSQTGSTRKIVSPIRSAVEQTYAWKNAELRNRTMQAIVKQIQVDPKAMEGIAEIVKKPSTSYRDLDRALREGGAEEFLDLLDNDFKSLFKKNSAGEENVVRAMVNGQPVFVKVHNPEAVKALLGLGAEQSGIILNVMQKLSNATKRGATGVFAPMFAVKSLGADTIQAAIQSPNAFKHLAVDLPHAIVSSIADVLRIPGIKNLAEDFRRSGGEYSALLRGDRPLNRSVYQLRREAPFTPQGVVKGAYNLGRGVGKAFEKIADSTENVNRMAAFSRAMKGKERTPENVRNAINAARESTTNFSRKGAFANQSEAFVPYMNAAIQGMYRITKAFSSPKTAAKTVAGLTTLVVMPKLYEYARFNDDPDYQKLPARERYRNVIIGKNEDGTFKKLFMPPEYEAFAAFFTDVLNDVVNNDPQAYKGTLDSLSNAFTPPLVSGALQGATQGGGVEQSLKGALNSTVLAPAVAIAGNQSFTGAPIVPKRLDGNSPEFQYDERTSSPAKWIGKKLGFAPMKVDYLIRAYGGDPARLLLPLTSDAGGGTPRNTLLKNFIADPVFTNTLSNDFFDAKDKFTKAKNDYQDFQKPLPSWYSEEMFSLLNSQAKGSASKRLSTLNEEKRQVNGNKLIGSKDKADKLRDIQAQINDIYADVNSALSSNGYKFPNR